LIPFFLLLSSSLVAQNQLTVFYFGSTSCGPCNRADVIDSINLIESDFDSLHQNYTSKLVMVVMDKDLNDGFKYVQKYNLWDEVSIGSHYNNEHTLSYLNKKKLPGVPHILIFEDTFQDSNAGTKIINSRKLVYSVMGGDQIVEWANSRMKL